MACKFYMYVKAVGNKGAFVDKISSRTFCAAVHKDHLSSHLAKTRSPNAARSPLISLLCPRAAGTQIVIPSVPWGSSRFLIPATALAGRALQ